jgi:hypothetical protein
MARQFLVPIDLAKNELQNARIGNLASTPGTPVEGQIYQDTTTHAAYVWNGTAWRPVDAAKLTDGTIPNTALATNPLARGNHTGTQAASTISDLASVVKAYRLDEFAVPTASVSLNSQKITNLADPSADTDAANKRYVDSTLAGLSWKEAVRVASTANIATLSGLLTVDTVTLVAGDRVLVKDQSTLSQNGIYVAGSGAWTRALDADSQEDLLGLAVMIQEGATQAGGQWIMTTDGTINVGSTNLNFTQFGGGTTYTAGDGLTGTTTFAVGAGTGISVSADAVAIDTSVVVRKYATSVGDNSATQFTVTHNLNTTDVTVQVHRVASPYDVIDCEIECATVNTVIVRFSTAPSSNQFRVVVHG